MNKDYDRKKMVETLEILNEQLPKLNEIFKEQGVESFNFHSSPATKIGKVTGEPAAWNRGAFSRADSSYHLLEHDVHGKYGRDQEIRHLYAKVGRNLTKVRKTVMGLEDKTTSVSEKVLSFLFLGLAIAGMFFFYPSITGNVVGNVARETSSIFGGVFLVLGILGAFFISRK